MVTFLCFILLFSCSINLLNFCKWFKSSSFKDNSKLYLDLVFVEELILPSANIKPNQ